MDVQSLVLLVTCGMERNKSQELNRVRRAVLFDKENIYNFKLNAKEKIYTETNIEDSWKLLIEGIRKELIEDEFIVRDTTTGYKF